MKYTIHKRGTTIRQNGKVWGCIEDMSKVDGYRNDFAVLRFSAGFTTTEVLHGFTTRPEAQVAIENARICL